MAGVHWPGPGVPGWPLASCLKDTFLKSTLQANDTAAKLSDYCDLYNEVMILVTVLRNNKIRAVSILSFLTSTVVIRSMLGESQFQVQSAREWVLQVVFY